MRTSQHLSRHEVFPIIFVLPNPNRIQFWRRHTALVLIETVVGQHSQLIDLTNHQLGAIYWTPCVNADHNL